MTISRRGVLGAALAGGASLLLGVCDRDRGRARSATPPARRSTVAIVRPSEFASYGEALDAALALAGGLAFVRADQRVVVKPAVNSARRYPATTDPETVYRIARAVKEAGAAPLVADRTMFRRSTAAVLRETGIQAAAAEAGAACLPLDDRPVVALRDPRATSWPDETIGIYQDVAAADHVIDLCTPRTHSLGDFTMALKNLVGVVAGDERGAMHRGRRFRARLAEISLVVRPSLIVLDGRQGFGDGGPDTGALVRPDFLAVGSDPIAVDAVGLAFLRREGANDTIGAGSIWRLPVLARAVELGLGAPSADHIDLVGVPAALAAALQREMA